MLATAGPAGPCCCCACWFRIWVLRRSGGGAGGLIGLVFTSSSGDCNTELSGGNTGTPGVVFCAPRLTSFGYEPCDQIVASKPAGSPPASTAVSSALPPALFS